MTFANCGYMVTQSFQQYCSLLFQSYIDNERYCEKAADGATHHSYPPQFVRMNCDNGRQYMTNIVYALASTHKADVMVRAEQQPDL